MVNIRFLYNTHPSNYGKGRRSGRGIKYIVVHSTGNKGDTASNNALYFARTANLKTSAHYFVDENEIINTVGEDKIAWHCGDGKGKYGITNANSIGIEMCNCTFVNEKVIKNTIDLISWIEDRYYKEQGRSLIICRHYDASKKLCPGIFVDTKIKGFNSIYNLFRTELGRYPLYYV